MAMFLWLLHSLIFKFTTTITTTAMTPTPRPKKKYKAKTRKSYHAEIKRHAARLVLKQGCTITCAASIMEIEVSTLTSQIAVLKLNAPSLPTIDPASPIRASAEKFFRGKPLEDGMVFPDPSGTSRRKLYDYLAMAREQLDIAVYIFASELLAMHLVSLKTRRPNLVIRVITDQGEARTYPKPLAILRAGRVEVRVAGGSD